jgi:hypothetical protein
LLFNLIEMIANGIYGNDSTNNRERFSVFIESQCDWPDANRVSIQQLQISALLFFITQVGFFCNETLIPLEFTFRFYQI